MRQELRASTAAPDFNFKTSLLHREGPLIILNESFDI